MNWVKNNFSKVLAFLGIAGVIDAGYLTYEHYASTLPPCSTNIFVDCGKVLHSSYAIIFGVPMSLLGLIYYLTILVFVYLAFIKKIDIFKKLIILLSLSGFIFSLYLVYLQLIVIKSICLYCMVSALTSTSLFVVSIWGFANDRIELFTSILAFKYKYIFKPLFFKIDPEKVHEGMVSFGEMLGKNKTILNLLTPLFRIESPRLKQKIAGITFDNPIGLAAGFDYDAHLTQSLSMIGFGFQTAGTITNIPYEGNPRPMLGRLPKSQSLMVNKGFKSNGAEKIAKKLKGQKFTIPLGISIGRSNNSKLKTQKESIKDIITSFKMFDSPSAGERIKNAYYEMNISCPNLIHGDVTFYPSKNLNDLLTALDKLKLTKPLFIKMPIDRTDSEVISMLKVITKHKVAGVIFGNLQKDRKNKALIKEEVNKFKVGNFSGKPTYERSNELISLAHKKFGDRLVIIGCGGVFSASDAYEKIKRGASLIQLITGMIFVGPQLISQINSGLLKLLKRDGFDSISQAIGSNFRK